MANIIPFRGYRFDPDKAGDPSTLVSPPYDRVYDDVREELHNKSPHNIVRVIKGKPAAADNEQSNVYTRAADALNQWIGSGILVRDAEPGFYAYHQDYSFGGERLSRKGFIALGKLEPEKVHAHERTLKGPKEDRLRLMRATEGNFGHIFMLYNDPDRTADRAIAKSIEGTSPVVEAVDADGNQHRVWRITDPAVISVVQEALAGRDLYIADGHHRYETAVNFMQECGQKGWTPAAPESFDVRMMTLFNIAEPGMSIRPIYRLVHGVQDFDIERFVTQAEEQFVVSRHASFDAMAEATAAGRKDHTFGCVAKGAYITLKLRDEASLAQWMPADRSDDWKRLDVSILHTMVLERLFGIDAKALEEQTHVTYTVDLAKGLEAVESGAEQLFLVLNPTSAEEVVRVADHGEKMPQKSTDFYPKLLTGLVLTRMEINK